MEISFVLFMTLGAAVTPVSAAPQLGIIESLLLAAHQRPWLWSVYVFTVGLPIILFISFMWPDKRFGPPEEQYYYKKSDDAQPDHPESSPLTQSVDVKAKADKAVTRKRDNHGNHRKSDLDLKTVQEEPRLSPNLKKCSGTGANKVKEPRHTMKLCSTNPSGL
ncbi:calmegin-like isoform X2 [Channa argus]